MFVFWVFTQLSYYLYGCLGLCMFDGLLCLCQNNNKVICLQCDNNLWVLANVQWIEEAWSQTNIVCDMTWHEITWYDLTWHGMYDWSTYVMMWCVMWHDMLWHSMTWGDIWQNITWHDVTLCDVTWHVMLYSSVAPGVWHGIVCNYGMWHDLTWQDITWHHTIWHDFAGKSGKASTRPVIFSKWSLNSMEMGFFMLGLVCSRQKKVLFLRIHFF